MLQSVSPVLLWFLAGIVFFAAELAAPGFVVFFFGLGAWCTALTLWGIDLPPAAQGGLFLGSSLLLLFFLRSRLRSVFIGRSEDTVGEGEATGIVVEAIRPPATGRVKFGGTTWQAAAAREIPEGTVVRIERQQNLLLQVHPMENQPEKS